MGDTVLALGKGHLLEKVHLITLSEQIWPSNFDLYRSKYRVPKCKVENCIFKLHYFLSLAKQVDQPESFVNYWFVIQFL